MSEFLGNYGFFILIALFMVICHLGHSRHGDHGRGGQGRDDDKSFRPGGHQH